MVFFYIICTRTISRKTCLIARIALLILLISHQHVQSQTATPFIKNYPASQLNASSSNWGITQDHRGVIFAANYEGIITESNQEWQLIPVSKNFIAFYVNKDAQNRIFISSHGDLGYLRPDYAGKLVYHSLKDLVDADIKDNIFWQVHSTSHGTYFQSPETITRWSEDGIKLWPAEKGSSYRFSFMANDDVYVVDINNKVTQFTASGSALISPYKEPAQGKISLIMSGQHDDVLFLNNDGSIYSQNTAQYINGSEEFKKFVRGNILYTGVWSPSLQRYAIGTLAGGIIICDTQFNIVQKIDINSGISSNVIKDLYFDDNDNLWCATNDGISYIELSSPWTRISARNKPLIKPLSLAGYDNKYYLGTTEGLYSSQPDSTLKLILAAKTWGLLPAHGTLYAATQKGLYTIGRDINEIGNYNEVTAIKPYSSKSAQGLIVGHSGGISILSKTGTKYREVNKFDIPPSTYHSIEFSGTDESAWISSKFDGLIYIHNIFSSTTLKKYNLTHGLPDINAINIARVDDQLLFATTKGFYRFDKATELFTPDGTLMRDTLHINQIIPDHNSGFIVNKIDEYRRSHVTWIRKKGAKYESNYTPFRRLPNMEITALFSDDQFIWVGGSEGLYRFNKNRKKVYDAPYHTIINRVSAGDSVIFYGNYYNAADSLRIPGIVIEQPEAFKPELLSKDNHIIFNFNATFYEDQERTVYSYYLENEESSWSKWTHSSTKEYTNLDAGEYVFHVKAKNIYDTESSVASYAFKILPPWYQTTWAYFIFGLLITLLIYIIAVLYAYRIRMQRRRLKLIVADRTFEIISQKREIEQQKDMLTLQFEKISKQKDSIEEKNSELQKAQRETMEANNALQELNMHLEREVEKRTKKIKTTLHQLQLKNKELDTFIYRASHDLEGPISRIGGLSALVKMSLPQSHDPQYVNLIDETAKSMKALIAKLTQVHEIYNAEIVNEPLDLYVVVEEIKRKLADYDEAGEVSYTLKIEPNLNIVSDKAMLSKALSNVIENALIYRKPRSTDHNITIKAKRTGEYIKLKVKDTGVGIDAMHIDKIFTMFYRGAATTQGSGLGLYLTKLAVERLNGKITVKSKLHEYTTFTIYLPLG